MSERGCEAPAPGPRQHRGPATIPPSGRQLGVLTWGTALTVVAGIYFALLAVIAWHGIGASPAGSWVPGEKAQAVVKAALLFPGPWVALLVAWTGYTVLRRRNGPGPGVAWFSAVMLTWFLACACWALPWLALS